MAYITTPLETDPDQIAQEVFDRIQSTFVNWAPADGNLDTILIEAWAQVVAELRELETDVRDQIFRRLGSSLHGLVPIDATSATGNSTWTMINNLGYTIEAGTQVAIGATGDESIAFEVASEVVVPPGSTSTAAGGVSLVAVEGGANGSGLAGTVDLVDALEHVQSIALVGQTTGGVDAESDDDYLARLVEELRLLTPRPILPEDFAVLARRVAGVARAVAVDLYSPEHNFLSVNQSSLETDTTGWAANANCSIIRSSAQAADGTASLRLSSTASGDMSATTPTGTLGEPVTAGDQYTALASFRADALARSVRVDVRWYTSGGATISTTAGSATADTITGFTQASVTAVAPATAVFAAVIPVVVATGGVSELHYVDKVAFRRGASLVWAAGGIDDDTNERTVTVVGVDENGAALSASTKAAVKTLLEAQREVNFVVHVADPAWTTVNVTFTAVTLPGWTPSDVKVRAEQAVANYLDPSLWGAAIEASDWINERTLRFGELYAVLNAADGLNYVTALTINGAANTDLTLAGIVALPTPGTITGTVT